jgi:hypothetical protein
MRYAEFKIRKSLFPLQNQPSPEDERAGDVYSIPV